MREAIGITQPIALWIENQHDERMQNDTTYADSYTTIAPVLFSYLRDDAKATLIQDMEIKIFLNILLAEYHASEMDREDKLGMVDAIRKSNEIGNLIQDLRLKLAEQRLFDDWLNDFSQLVSCEEKEERNDETTHTSVRCLMMNEDQGSLPDLPYYAGKCGTCQHYHMHPNCKVCGHKRKIPGECHTCKADLEDEMYKGYCGLCQNYHELPSCFHCKQLRYQPRQCQHCRAPGPDEKIQSTFTPCERNEEHIDENVTIDYSVLKDNLLQELKRKTAVRNRIKKIANYNCDTKYIAGQARRDKLGANPNDGTDLQLMITPVANYMTSLSTRILDRSLCKLVPLKLLPKYLVTPDNCAWCGSVEHKTVDCNAYLTWIQECIICLHKEEEAEILDVRLQNAKKHLREYYDAARPWNFYIDLEDGEYYSPLGAPVMINDKRIINLIPYSAQNSTLPTSWLPTPSEMGSLTRLSDTVGKSEGKTFQQEMKDDVNMLFDYMENVSQTTETTLEDIQTSIRKLKTSNSHYFDSYTDFHQNLVDQMERLKDQINELQIDLQEMRE